MLDNSTHQDRNPSEYERMLELLAEAKQFSSSQPNISLEKAQEGLHLARKFNNVELIALAQYLSGASHSNLRNYEIAAKLATKNIEFIYQYLPQNIEYLFNSYNLLGVVYSQTGAYQKALKIFLKAASLKSASSLPLAYNNLGNVYRRVADYQKAIECYQVALELTDKNVDIARYVTITHNIAFIYETQGKSQKARQNLETVISTLEQDHNIRDKNIATYLASINGLSEIYREEKNYAAANELLDRTLQLGESVISSTQYPMIIIAKGMLLLELKDEINAINYLKEGLEYASKNKLHTTIKRTLKKIIKFYGDTKRLDKAFPYLEQLYEMSEEQTKISRAKDFEAIINEREREIQVLESKNQEIEKHNAILEQFTYIISHDLREPVRGINGFANLLDKKFHDKLGVVGKDYIDFILSETGNINGKLGRLLEYTTFKKPETDEVADISIQQIIKQQKKQFASVCQLDIDCDDIELKMVQTHADRLLYELIDNAVKFRKEERICRIEIGSELKNDQQYLTIKDYGIGISEEYHERIFKIFNQLNKQTEGLGVGLAICERIVGLYNGRIWVKSVPDEFTIFYISVSASLY